ncbi:MAG: hypothetical protein Q9173_001940 [Seirophora scorigena]
MNGRPDPHGMPDDNAFGGGYDDGYEDMNNNFGAAQAGAVVPRFPQQGMGHSRHSRPPTAPPVPPPVPFPVPFPMQLPVQAPANGAGLTMSDGEAMLMGRPQQRRWHGGNGLKVDHFRAVLAPALGCQPGEIPGPWHVLAALVIGEALFTCEGTNHTSWGQCESHFRVFMMRQARQEGYDGPVQPQLVLRYVRHYVRHIRRRIEGGGRGRRPRPRY